MAENRNAQQVREITDKLEQGIKELFESERFKEYLRTMSKFYNYSFNNTLLIAMQKPEATYVAGYTSVSYTHLDVYKRQSLPRSSLYHVSGTAFHVRNVYVGAGQP